MKYSKKEFAEEIRKLYPGDYDDLNDSDLVDLWLRKYPNDKEKVELNSPKMNYRWIFYVLIAVVVGIKIFYKNDSTVSNNNDAGTSQILGNKDSDEDILIDEEAMKKVNESELIKNMELNEREKLTLTIIFSDTNPDAENKAGLICEEYYTNCKWCNNSILQQKEYWTIQKALNFILFNPIGQWGTAIISSVDGGEGMKTTVKNYILSFEDGEKYTCESFGTKEFCSERCKHEYELNK